MYMYIYIYHIYIYIYMYMYIYIYIYTYIPNIYTERHPERSSSRCARRPYSEWPSAASRPLGANRRRDRVLSAEREGPPTSDAV